MMHSMVARRCPATATPVTLKEIVFVCRRGHQNVISFRRIPFVEVSVMYAPPAFRVTDAAKLISLIEQYPFAMLARNSDDGPVIAHIPLVAEIVDGVVEALVGHVAKANPFWDGADKAQTVAVFTGPEAYVSPAHYASKQAHGKVVPTWNYIRVEARGRLRVETAASNMQSYIDRPTEHMEQNREAAWATRDAPEAYIQRLSNAIVGLRLNVEQIEGVWKLSQNKSEQDFSGVANGLLTEGATDVANAMAALSQPSKLG